MKNYTKLLAIILAIMMMATLMVSCFEEDYNSDNDQKQKIVMPKNASDYIGSEWTIDDLTEHFTELGFNNIRSVPCEPNDDDYNINIYQLVVDVGWSGTEEWQAGNEYDSDAEITIYYNESPCLTVDNCPDLVTILTSEDIDYKTFATKYDGKYFEFDAYVVDNISYMGDTEHIIDVAGELDDSLKGTPGLIIQIGDRSWGCDIATWCEAGDHVKVSGRIDLSWSEYYKHLYIECRRLEILVGEE